jgi:hypothetical protein
VEEFQPDEDAYANALVIPDADEFDIDAHHQFIAAKVMLPQGGQVVTRCVINRKCNHDRKI